jgi:MerR family transcriptional regulator, light-induced transcriptional regulator
MQKRTQTADTDGFAAPGTGSSTWQRDPFVCVIDESERRLQSQLSQVIEAQIIPRLLLSSRAGAVQPTVDVAPSCDPAVLAEQVPKFAEVIVDPDTTLASAYFRDLLAQGYSAEGLFTELLAPTARRLGTLWEEDIADFSEVTYGLSRLHQLIREFSPAFGQYDVTLPSAKRALIMPFPGETHAFGAAIVEAIFRKEGWLVWGGPPGSIDDVLDLVRTEWFDVIGFSISKEGFVPGLAELIQAVRQNSLNPAAFVLAGGRAFVDRPELVAAVGADATACDAFEAVKLVSSLSNGSAIG